MENEWSESRRKRRDRLYIISEILNIAKDGSLKTQIMYGANLSFAQLNEYLSFLLKTNLLKVVKQNQKDIYKTTTKGIEYLQNYKKIRNLLRKEEEDSAKINSPIFWLKKDALGYK